MNDQRLPQAEPCLRIGLNAHLLSWEASYRGAGLSRYIYSLLTYLPLEAEGLLGIAFVGNRRIRFPGWRMCPSLWPTANPLARILWEQTAQPWRAWRERLDLLHEPAYVGPWVPPCPVVVSVHDLTFYRFPQWFRPFNWRYLQRFTRQTVRQAHHIIASSQHTREDLIALLDVPPERITVIPLGVGEEMRPMQDAAALATFRHKRQLPERMILYLGTLEPRKNLTTLLEAYALLRRDPRFPHRLVIAGGKGWYYEEIEATVARLHLGQAVLFAGYVPQEELPWWYNAADVFVYPSLYEGFGLPPLEAMACGAPVVVSAASSLPEVVGEAGVIVPPLDAQALAEAIREVVEDGQRRQRLIAAGLARAQALSWRATAAKTAKLYRHLLTEAKG